jgi:hypothetical protein
MPRVGFETTIQVLEPAKTVSAFDRAATVIDFRLKYFTSVKLHKMAAHLRRAHNNIHTTKHP